MSAKKRRARRMLRERTFGSRLAGTVLYVVLVVVVSVVLATVGWTWAGDVLALNKEYASTIITIPPESIVEVEKVDEDGNTYTVRQADIEGITTQLEEEGLIDYGFLFRLYAWFSKAETKITAGTYSLDTNMDYRALVVNMGKSSATRQTIDVTIPEGYTVDQIFRLLDERGVSTVDALEDMAANWAYKWDFLQELPLGDHHRLEGYLFPDTYTFYLGEDPKYVLNKMLARFDEKMRPYFDLFTEESPFTLHEIVIMASMIEKETDGDDYKTIASVLYNRLNNPTAETAGFLQIDATLVYVNGGRVPTNEDKELDSPYNTYKYKGLVPGPISNPGMASLYAALEPDQTGYFFYALNPATGKHEFSRTYQEHLNRLAGY